MGVVLLMANLPPPAFCAAMCAAWHQGRDDRFAGTGCGAIILDKARGCLVDKAKVAEWMKKNGGKR